MEKTPVLVDTNILSTFAKIERFELLFEIMNREKVHISTYVLHELDMAENVGYAFVQIIFDYIDKEKDLYYLDERQRDRSLS